MKLLVLVSVCISHIALGNTNTGGTCTEDGRATKYDSCTWCGYRIHAPKTPGKYALMRKYETVQEMRDGWYCEHCCRPNKKHGTFMRVMSMFLNANVAFGRLHGADRLS